MGEALTRDERIRLWSALSDAFVDNEVDYPAIARQLAGFDPAVVRAAFFEEVAPVCHKNLRAPIPPIWTAFGDTWLTETASSPSLGVSPPARSGPCGRSRVALACCATSRPGRLDPRRAFIADAVAAPTKPVAESGLSRPLLASYLPLRLAGICQKRPSRDVWSQS